MAQLPCTMCGDRFRGASTHCYPAVVSNGVGRRKHHRLCKTCWDETLDFVTAHGWVWEPDQVKYPDGQFQCALCALPVTQLDSVLIMTFYEGKQDRQDAQSYLHDECGDVVSRRWALE